MTASAFSPSSVLVIALVLSIVYMLVGVMAFAHVRPDYRPGKWARRLRMDPWWHFHSADFHEAGKRLCGLGKALFVITALAFAASAWIAA